VTAYNVLSPSAMAAGQPEDISVILGNFQALAGIINGQLDNGNLSPGAAIAISKLAGYPANAQVFLRGDGTWAGATPTYGPVLPVAPVDGQEHILVDSATNPDWQWRFRYNAGNTTGFKWEFIGGAPRHPSAAGGMVTASAAFVDLTGGPTFVVPRAGTYIIFASALFSAPGGINSFQMQVFGSITGGILNSGSPVETNVSGLSRWNMLSDRANLAAGETINLKVRATTATQINIGTSAVAIGVGASLAITPVRIA
jgi:hypothetical protein